MSDTAQTSASTTLRDSPSIRRRGRVDRVEDGLATGWAFLEGAEDTPAELEVLQDNAVIGRITADGYRKDLAEQGFREGYCAFQFKAPDGLTLDGPRLQIRFADDGTPLRSAVFHGGTGDPAAQRVVELEETLGGLRSTLATRLDRVERAVVAIYQLHQDPEEEQPRLTTISEALERVESFVAVNFARHLQTTLDQTIREAVAEGTRRQQRWLKALAGMVAVLLLLNGVLLAALVLGV